MMRSELHSSKKRSCTQCLQIALRWIIETGCIPVPKSFNKSHMSENLEIFDWELTDEDRQKISTIPQARGSCAEFMVNEATGPYRTLQELWDDEGDNVAS